MIFSCFFLEGNFNFATIFWGPPGGPTGMVESSLITYIYHSVTSRVQMQLEGNKKIEICGRPCSTVYESQTFGYRVFGMIM